MKFNLFYESTYLTFERKESIKHIMVQAFVCAKIPFRIIENSYIIELFRQLYLVFTSLSREMLVGKLIDNKLS